LICPLLKEEPDDRNSAAHQHLVAIMIGAESLASAGTATATPADDAYLARWA